MKIKELLESINSIPQLLWNSNPQIGWWEDSNKIRLYHGTDILHLDSFAKDGLNRPDPKTGMYSFALEPFTARAFATMGGEARFLAAKSKAMVVPQDRRCAIVFDLPLSWVKQNMDHDLHGNDPEHKLRLRDRELYNNWNRGDQQYYQLCEIRVSTPVNSHFIIGYMIR